MNKSFSKILLTILFFVDILFVVFFLIFALLVYLNKAVLGNLHFIIFIIAIVVNFVFLIYSLIILIKNKQKSRNKF